MSARYRGRVAAVAMVALAVGAPGVAAAAVSHAQPADVPVPLGFDCPLGGAFSGVQYVADPENQNAYYVCAGGLPQQHAVCAANTTLNMSAYPPACVPWRASY